MIKLFKMTSLAMEDPVPISRNPLLGGRVVLSQPTRGYRAAIDPVFLAAAVPAVAGETVLDAGSGAGAAALCLAARVPGCRVVGVEIDPAFAAMARDNAAENGFADRVDIRMGDLAAGLPPDIEPASVHHAMANPPHLDPARGTAPSSGRVARVEGRVGLANWIAFLLAAVRPRGTVTIIHRADRLDDVLFALRGRAGGVIVYPLWPKLGWSAKRVIVQARKGSHAAMTVQPGLILHQADGQFTDAADAVLRRAGGLPVATAH